jgi:hypothetical protein
MANDGTDEATFTVSGIDTPTCLRIDAAEWRRKLDNAKDENGGADAQIFACAQGVEYLVKATNNPQGGKVVVNDLIGGLALEWLGVLRPRTTIVNIPQSVIDMSPGSRLNNGNAFVAGESFGCPYWVSQTNRAVQPASIANWNDVAGTTVFDAWFNNEDGRQWRARQKGTPNLFEFFPVDQGHCVKHSWDASLAVGDITVKPPCIAVDPSKAIHFSFYVNAYVKRLEAFTEQNAQQLVSEIPTNWLTDGERSALTDYVAKRAPMAAAAIKNQHPQVKP